MLFLYCHGTVRQQSQRPHANTVEIYKALLPHVRILHAAFRDIFRFKNMSCRLTVTVQNCFQNEDTQRHYIPRT